MSDLKHSSRLYPFQGNRRVPSSSGRVHSSERQSAATVQFDGIEKSFGPIRALDQVSCTVAPGTVHAFLGENGAGKTTLMRLLGGICQPDGGRLLLDGRELRVRSVACARRLGIGMVHQHFSLQPGLSVLENVAVGQTGNFFLQRSRLSQRINEVAHENGLIVEPGALVADLSYAERQRVEILRLLLWGARIIILDEPTSLLSAEEARSILGQVKALARTGCSILLVTHKLREVQEFADMVTVLRQGRLIATVRREEADEMRLAEMMFGRQVRRHVEVRRRLVGDVTVELDGVGLSGHPGSSRLSDVSFEVRRGEIVGLGGAAGNGQEALMEILAGSRKPTSGRVRWSLKGGVSPTSPDAVAYIPADRLGLGVSPGLEVWENLILRRFTKRPLSRWGLLDRRKALDTAYEMARIAGLAESAVGRETGHLSGGNVQRLILGRELWNEPQVILAEEPTHGLDLAGISLVHMALHEHAAQGAAVIVASSDLDELHALADRIIVMFRGEATEFTSGPDGDRRASPAMAMAGLSEPHTDSSRSESESS